MQKSKLKMVSLYVMSFFYVMAGFNHFKNPEFYLKMMPDYLPAHGLLNAASGAIEMLLGMLLIRPETRSLAAWGVVLLLIAIFPANWYMFSQGGAAYGFPDWALILRLPMQLVLIAWAYWHTKNPELDTRIEQSDIEIEASVSDVWATLTALDSYRLWNTSVVRASGEVFEGSKIQLLLREPDGIEFKSQNMVTKAVPDRNLEWRGSFLFRGLFDRITYFRITPAEFGRCVVTCGERLEGILVGLLSHFVGISRPRLDVTASGLKSRLEKK